MKKMLLWAALSGILGCYHRNTYAVSQFRSPFSWFKLCGLGNCMSNGGGPNRPSYQRFARPPYREEVRNSPSKTVSAYGSPTIYVNVSTPDQDQARSRFKSAYPGTALADPMVVGNAPVVSPNMIPGFGPPAMPPPGYYSERDYDAYADSSGCNQCCWNIRPIGYGYCRFASEATSCFEGSGSITSNLFNVDTTKASITSLFFGKEDFTVEDAFPDSLLNCKNPEVSPFLIFSKLSPRLEFQETGFFLGLHAQYRTGCFRVGAYVAVPYKTIQVTVTSFAEEGLEAVVYDPVLDQVMISCAAAPPCCDPDGDNSDFAYRLDFLCPDMVYGGPIVGTPTRLVDSMADVTIGATPAAAPVYVVKRDSETHPIPIQLGDGINAGTLAAGKTTDQVTAELTPDGDGTNDSTYNFSPSVAVDYEANLGVDREAQRSLWMVPHFRNDGAGNAVYANADTHTAQQMLRRYLENTLEKETATEFLCRVAGINLQADQKNNSVGDLIARFYAGYCSACFGANIFIEGSFPTGKRMEDVSQVYFVTAGNNGHVDLKFGVEFDVMFAGIIGISGDIAGDLALSSIENKASAFQGATVRNIGTQVDAGVSWNSLVGHVDVSAQVGCFGVIVGYEGYSKGDDMVDFSTGIIATDFLDQEAPMDPRLLEECTNTVTHKVRGALYYVSGNGKFFAGSSLIPAGHNAMREMEVFLGFAATF